MPLSARRASTATRPLLPERTTGRLRRSIRAARVVLPDDHSVALVYVARHFGDASVRETRANKSRLNRFIAGEDPYSLKLSALTTACTLLTAALALTSLTT